MLYTTNLAGSNQWHLLFITQFLRKKRWIDQIIKATYSVQFKISSYLHFLALLHFCTPLRVRVGATVSVKQRFFMISINNKRGGVRKCNAPAIFSRGWLFFVCLRSLEVIKYHILISFKDHYQKFFKLNTSLLSSVALMKKCWWIITSS